MLANNRFRAADAQELSPVSVRRAQVRLYDRPSVRRVVVSVRRPQSVSGRVSGRG